jgi:uncharacterized membrane protein
MRDPDDRDGAAGRAARRSAGGLPLERFSAFSDGVFAIAITLLVLELPAPSLAEGIGSALAEFWPDFLAYLMSFAYIRGYWISHSRLTGTMKAADSSTYGLNLLLLLFVTLLPFSTRLLRENFHGPELSLAAVIYGLDVLVASFVMSMLILHVARQPQLFADSPEDDALRRLYRQRWFAIGVGAIAVGLAVVAPAAAVLVYLVVALLFLVLPMLGYFRVRRSAG